MIRSRLSAFRCLLLAASLAVGLPVWPLAAAEAPPNVVILLADDLGHGDLSCYGNDAFATPELDALARGGLRFTDFHASGPVCSPTRAGLLTGRYQQRAGIPGVILADPKDNRHHGLQPTEVTLPELLKTKGYRSGLVGKWHLGYDAKFGPPVHGFDWFRGYVSGNIDYQSHYDRMGFLDWWKQGEIEDEPGYVTELITRHAVEFLRRSRDEPFFLLVAHEAPHTPLQGPDDPAFRVAGRVVPEPKLPPRQQKARYQAMVQALDESVGRVVDELESLGLRERTLVFFLSDNGGTRLASNGPLRGYKGSVWEGGTRVPAIASWPGRIPAGSETSATTISLDLMPTALELAGVSAPADRPLDGRSLVSLFDGEELPPRPLFWSYRNQQAVRDGRWKLVRTTTKQGTDVQLFDLSADLEEQHDLRESEPARVRELTEALERWLEDVERNATPQPER